LNEALITENQQKHEQILDLSYRLEPLIDSNFELNGKYQQMLIAAAATDEIKIQMAEKQHQIAALSAR
jgi:hypothetical protein